MSAAITLSNQAKQAGSDASELHHSLAYRLGALLSAAENLADCHRVLSDFSSHDRVTDGGASAVFSEACSSWRNPLNENGFGLIQGLLQLAQDLCSESADQAESLSGQIGAMGQTLDKIDQVVALASKGGEA